MKEKLVMIMVLMTSVILIGGCYTAKPKPEDNIKEQELGDNITEIVPESNMTEPAEENKVSQRQYSNCNNHLVGNITQMQSFRVPFTTLTNASFIALVRGEIGEVTIHIKEGISGSDITNITKSS